jgi:tryptophan 2,3-dioxygenase
MKSNSGKPYVKPSNIPTFTLMKGDVKIEVYETSTLTEIFQSMNGHTQRLTMAPNEYTNFHNRLLQAGFVV